MEYVLLVFEKTTKTYINSYVLFYRERHENVFIFHRGPRGYYLNSNIITIERHISTLFTTPYILTAAVEAALHKRVDEKFSVYTQGT